MRQRLINKTEPQENSLLKSEKTMVGNTAVDDPISLHSLLFDGNIGKVEWMDSVKHHSNTIASFLLNDQIEAFDHYLKNQLSGEILEFYLKIYL